MIPKEWKRLLNTLLCCYAFKKIIQRYDTIPDVIFQKTKFNRRDGTGRDLTKQYRKTSKKQQSLSSDNNDNDNDNSDENTRTVRELLLGSKNEKNRLIEDRSNIKPFHATKKDQAPRQQHILKTERISCAHSSQLRLMNTISIASDDPRTTTRKVDQGNCKWLLFGHISHNI